MVVKQWWMILVWVAIFAIMWAVWYYVVRKQKKRIGATKQVKVAHSNRIVDLPGYGERLRQYKIMVWVVIGVLVIGLLASFVLTLRVSSRVVQEPEMRNRDIVLCLDVSGSMLATDKQLVETFSSLAKEFDGERIALTVFDSSSSTVFPLTDDYTFIKEQLDKASTELDINNDNAYGVDSVFGGTYEGDGSSLIGDGLASCVMRFDTLDTKRSRSVIFATDNYANGAQIIDLKQAGAFAKDKGVRVYGVNPGDYSSEYYVDEAGKEFKDVVMATDGAYYKIDYESKNDKTVIAGIVEKIQAQEATRFKGAPMIVESDIPQWFVGLAALSVAVFLFIAWRLRI
jgi:Ca-activated chloride channel family protein